MRLGLFHGIILSLVLLTQVGEARGSHRGSSGPRIRTPRIKSSTPRIRSQRMPRPASPRSKLTPTSPRSKAAREQFQRHNPCPSTGRTKGACPGYVVDHIKPLACGGRIHHPICNIKLQPKPRPRTESRELVADEMRPVRWLAIPEARQAVSWCASESFAFRCWPIGRQAPGSTWA
jgi:hypothetical protein